MKKIKYQLKGGIVMMGGNRENDDISIENDYLNKYHFVVNSVETIVFHDQTTSEYVFKSIWCFKIWIIGKVIIYKR